ncbi:MAG: indole-3-glycerol phosphate synthase TrpC [Verrucomicrobiota bacterium]|nr:indole-3-glycerol phosphate synthase TrpC [Verrucomicrobiota bacterium]
MSVLDKILDYKRGFVESSKQRISPASMRTLAEKAPATASFAQALVTADQSVALIAEIKKASPSAGLIRADFDHLQIARDYYRAGANAISVLTDEAFFQGSLKFLEDVHKEVPLPLLRKDFTIDEYQVYEAKAFGASAVLLIVAALNPKEIVAFQKIAHDIGLDALVEVHDAHELKVALDCGSQIIGVNNRNLGTLHIDLAVSETLCPQIPQGIIRVGESGIYFQKDVERLRHAGVNAILVGESIMKSGDIPQQIGELLRREG